MLAILINAMVIFLMYFPTLEGNIYLEVVDRIIIFFFFVEACVKLKVLSPRGYFKSNWNRFDFFIVVASLPSLFVPLFHIPDTSLLIILRLLRLIRLVRFIRFVPHLGKIIAGLGRALQASLFVILALFLLNFLLALFTCHFYADIAPEFFGNPLIASYSIFQLFTVEGWNEIPSIISERLPKGDWQSDLFIGITRFYFAIIVLIGGIFGMSLANAVFVDEMTMDNNVVLEEKIDALQEQINHLQELIRDREKTERTN
ncbi:MAG: ion transporter [Saprospiraceae bacterium]|nr:ion transporter [Saprospiraceae bacterium]